MVNYINENDFNEYGKSKELKIVKFTASWCAPCKMIDPILEKVSEETSVEVGKVDIEKETDLTQKFQIRSVPTTMFFKNGELLETKVGAFDESYLRSSIENYN